MKNWIFSGESYEEGISYINGINTENQKIYRWEPLATKLRGEEAAGFRRSAEKRRKLLSELSGETGILIVEGPFNYQALTLLGWDALTGERLLGSCLLPLMPRKYEKHNQLNRKETSSLCPLPASYVKQNETGTKPFLSNLLMRIPVEEGIKKLEVLINTYHLFHRLGLIIGKPDWKRIYIGKKGVFTPDPYLLKFLASPEIPLPPGLSACYPPEVFSGKKIDEKGDMFFLGIIIYLLLSGQLPYPLIKGWPTTPILKGEIIPLTFYRPELHPVLAQKIENLLAVDPGKRSSSEELVELWPEASAGIYNTFPIDSGSSLREEKAIKSYKRELPWRKLLTVIASGLLLVLLFLTYFRGAEKKVEVTPAMAVEDFLKKASYPNFYGYHPELWMDLDNARKQRIEAVVNFLSHPLLEVVEVKEITRDSKRAKIEVTLIWNLWEKNVWQTKKTREFLVLEKKKSQWVVQKREPVY